MKNKILAVVTNQDHYEGTETPTGLWLSELTHFWTVVTEAGYEIDLVSPQGGKSPLEPKSLMRLMMDSETREFFENPAFMAKLAHTRAAKEVDWAAYVAVYYTGGHGVMFDFHESEALQAINRALYEHGRVVSTVCHGYCGLLNTKLSNGEYLVKGKELTGFSWIEEILAGVAKKVPYNIQAEIEKRGADYQKAFIPFVPYAVTDGNLVTGQNPGSAKKTAELVVARLRELGL